MVVTRRIRGQLLGELALVDRTCLGVKNADPLPLQPELALREHLEEIGGIFGGLRECDALEAQSVVFHALDYARSLGFVPHPDFEPALFEPRPDALLETPLAHPARPIYVSGLHDDVDMILNRLEERVGAQNYDFMGGNPIKAWFEEDEDDDDDEDVIETTAESSDELA